MKRGKKTDQQLHYIDADDENNIRKQNRQNIIISDMSAIFGIYVCSILNRNKHNLQCETIFGLRDLS